MRPGRPVVHVPALRRESLTSDVVVLQPGGAADRGAQGDPDPPGVLRRRGRGRRRVPPPRRPPARTGCTGRSVPTCSASSPWAAGSKSHSAAIRERKPAGSKRVMPRVAVRPSASRSQNAGTPMPPGATTPMPVTATRRVTRRPQSVPGGPRPRRRLCRVGRRRVLGVDVAELRARGERAEVEDHAGLHVADVAEAVAHVGGDQEPLVGPQRVRLAVQVHLQRAADDVHELLGVRVVVLADALAGLHDGQAHEAAGGAHRGRGEHGAQVAAAPAVGLGLAEVHDAWVAAWS